uniref:Vesicle associated membrane protein 1b n=1 Tax=Takifugu rubripes TaxID=31033 RepID=A0A674MNM1_TAKRU
MTVCPRFCPSWSPRCSRSSWCRWYQRWSSTPTQYLQQPQATADAGPGGRGELVLGSEHQEYNWGTSGSPQILKKTKLKSAVIKYVFPPSHICPPPPPPGQVVDIMRVNVDKVLERDQKLSELDDRADALQAGASQFESCAAKLKNKYWWKNCKMMIMMGIIGVIVVGIIFLYFFY